MIWECPEIRGNQVIKIKQEIADQPWDLEAPYLQTNAYEDLENQNHLFCS